MQMNKLQVLSEEEILKIHQSSLQVLSETGVKIHSESALSLLEENGANVDMGKMIAKLPIKMVKEALTTLPEKIDMYNSRIKELAFTLGDGKPHVECGHGVWFKDIETGDRRRVNMKDVSEFALISDVLEQIHIVGLAGIPDDVPQKFALAHACATVFNNTSKPIFFAPDQPKITNAVYDIARIVVDEDDLSRHPILICQVSPTSPLQWVEFAVEALMDTAKNGVPCNILPEPICGVTSPLTLAGHLVLNNSEWLSGVVISQLIRKGAPVIYSGCWTTFDMKRSRALVASPETSILRISGAQMARFYSVPCHSISFDTDAAILDAQYGAEKTLSILSSLNSGVDFLVNAGEYDSLVLVSHESLIADHEIIGMLSRFVKGMDVNKDSLAVDLINKVGPGGNFITEPHTLKYLRTGEHWETDIFNRLSYEKWRESGSPDIAENAKKAALEILKNYHPPKLPETKIKEIKKIIERYESRIE